MKKIITLISIAFIFLGCSSSNQNNVINGTYTPDIDYQCASLSYEGIKPEQLEQTKKMLKESDLQYRINYPEVKISLMSKHTFPPAGVKLTVEKGRTVYTKRIKKINDKLFLITSDKNGTEVIEPCYYDQKNSCIYINNTKISLKR